MNHQRRPAAQTDPACACTLGRQDQPGSARLPYFAPRLIAFGDVRNLTLGGSIGRGDSGAPERQARVGGI